jgi:hypothetical protein
MKIAKHYRPELLVSKGKEPNPLLTDPYLDAKAERIVATNGHALVALPVETEKAERSRYLSCSLLEAARKLGDDDVPAEIRDQEIVEFGVLWPAAQERTFPAWETLLPKHRRGDAGTTTITLDAKLLKALADAMGTGGGVRLTVQLGEAEAPILVQPCFGPDPEEVGLLMPMRDGEPLRDGQECPVCKKLLAAGAPCPAHGDPQKAAARLELEAEADELLKKAGDADLTKKDTKGDAVARKKKGRR